MFPKTFHFGSNILRFQISLRIKLKFQTKIDLFKDILLHILVINQLQQDKIFLQDFHEGEAWQDNLKLTPWIIIEIIMGVIEFSQDDQVAVGKEVTVC